MDSGVDWFRVGAAGSFCACCSSFSILRSHWMCLDAVLAAMYSTSDVERTTMFCFVDRQGISPLLRKCMFPVVDRRVSGSAA